MTQRAIIFTISILFRELIVTSQMEIGKQKFGPCYSFGRERMESFKPAELI